MRARRAALGLVVGMVLAAACKCQKPEAPVPLAKLSSAEGSVTLHRAGKAEAALSGGPLFSGDTLATGIRSAARVRYRDGQEVEVGESTRFRIDEGLNKLTLTLEEGVVVSRAPGAGPSGGAGSIQLTILTPYGEATVTPGAEVKLAVGAGKQSTLEVTQGEISVVGSDGKPFGVQAGQKLELEIGGIEVVQPVEASPSPSPSPAPSPSPPPATLEPISILLSAEVGAPLLRGEGGRFVRVTGKPVPVVEGAQVKVPPGARALLASKGLHLRLTGGAAGVLEKAVVLEGKERYEVALSAGEARVNFVGAGGREVAIGDGDRRVELRAAEEGAAVVTQGPRGPRVEVRAGEVELASGEATRRVRAGEAVELAGGRVEASPRPRPQLMLPASRNLRVFANGLKEVALAIPGGGDEAPVRVEVATDAAFSDLVLAGRVFGDHVVVAPPASGELHWRVVGPGGTPTHKGRVRFEHDSGTSPRNLKNPRAEVAETGLKASVYFQSTPPELSLVAAAHEGAARYRFRVYREGELKHPVYERLLPEARCTVAAGVLGEGDYLWHATPLSATGAELAGGRMNKLELVYDNARRTLAITRPRPGERVGPGGVEVQGVAPLGSKLYVNGKPAPLDEKGRFSLSVPSSDAVVFRLVSQAGAELYWMRKLARESK